MPAPVTARLSKLFYERLGEQVANELVDWFNAVDSTYKAELREFNELNFARFDAKVEQRFAQADAKLEQRFAAVEAKFEQRFAAVEAKFEQRFAQADAKLEKRLADLKSELMGEIGAVSQRLGQLPTQMADLKAELIKWMFLFWAGTALAGLLLR